MEYFWLQYEDLPAGLGYGRFSPAHWGTLAVLAALILLAAFWFQRLDSPRRNLYLVALLFCLGEYGLWTAGCLETEEASVGAYFYIYCLLSGTFLLFPMALGKVVRG